MRKIVLALLVCVLVGWSAGASAALQCVPYARQVSGIALKGDAWRWWGAADGVYERGSAPAQGAVLVFKATKSMRHGHVSVVSRVVSRREIRIDHANWGQGRNRGRIDRDVAVIDVSPRNDWTQVRVWHGESASFGRVNPAYGFIYQSPAAARAATTMKASLQAPQAAAKPQPVKTQQPAKTQPVKTPPAKAQPVKVPPAKPAPVAAPQASSAADDLNRMVLARLGADSEPAALTAKPGAAPGQARPAAPKPPQGSLTAPTGTKSKVTSERPRS